MTSADIKTGGMHCGSCSMMIEMTLDDLAGVTAAKADYVKGMAHVEFDESVVSVDEIVAAIREAGYTAEVAA